MEELANNNKHHVYLQCHVERDRCGKTDNYIVHRGLATMTFRCPPLRDTREPRNLRTIPTGAPAEAAMKYVSHTTD